MKAVFSAFALLVATAGAASVAVAEEVQAVPEASARPIPGQPVVQRGGSERGDAKAAMYGELDPLIDDLRTSMCRRATEVRIAAGETDAKCSRA